MKLNTLAPAPGAKKSGKRVGRGIGSGLGKTAGRGHKGQKSRRAVLLSPGSKVVKCLYNVVYRSLVLRRVYLL